MREWDRPGKHTESLVDERVELMLFKQILMATAKSLLQGRHGNQGADRSAGAPMFLLCTMGKKHAFLT